MNRKIIPLILITTLLIGIGCIGPFAEEESDVGPEDVNVEYKVIDEHNEVEVTVEGPEEEYGILVVNPEGEEIGGNFIAKENMATGPETVTANLYYPGEEPVEGEYTLIVKAGTIGNTEEQVDVFEDTFEYEN